MGRRAAQSSEHLEQIKLLWDYSLCFSRAFGLGIVLILGHLTFLRALKF